MTLKLNGLKFTFENFLEFVIIYIDIFIKKEYRFKAENDSPLILDCGAHIGISTLFFKKIYPDSRIICFEPNPRTFKQLERNIKQNNLKNVVLINKAVADKKGGIDFFISKREKVPWGWGDSIVKNKWYNPEKSKKIKVDAVNLSSFIDEKVDLLKLDVEGIEGKVLEEIEDKLFLIKEIIMEFHKTKINSENKLENVLLIFDKNGFKYTINQKKDDASLLMINSKRN